MNKKIKVISVIVCLVILCSFAFGCTKKSETPSSSPISPSPVTTSASIKALESRVAALESTIANINNKVSSMSADLAKMPSGGDYATRSEQEQFKAEINNKLSALTSTLDTAKTDIQTLKTALSSLNEQMSAAEKNIADIEDEIHPSGSGNGDVDPEDAVELDLRYFPMYTVKTGESSLSIPIRLKAENVLVVDIEEIELSLEVRLSSGAMSVKKMTLSGSGVVWSGYGSGDSWVFANWSSESLKAGERQTFDPILIIEFDSDAEADEDLMVSIGAYCDDFEYK